MDWRILWYAISLGILVGGYITMYVSFLYAYFINDKIFSISNNSIGEADFEFWFLLICSIFSIVGIWYYHKFGNRM